MNSLDWIEHNIKGLREQLTHHRLYTLLAEVEDIQVFMEKHVYAVWDFMSLLKALQNHLTCNTIPWKPVKNAKTARFINEIVFGEESDVNELGVPKSHFEMYLEAMQEVGANTDKILSIVDSTNSLADIFDIFSKANLKKAEQEFLEFTFNLIQTNAIHKIAAAFTFGREDLIPDMFIEIINKSNQEAGKGFPKLSYYLKRHIEIDGDEHGPLSLEMVSELCGQDDKKWEEATTVAVEALQKRIELWDEIADEIEAKQSQQVREMAVDYA